MSRTPLIVGNWKMNKTIPETKDFCLRLKNELAALKERQVEVAVAPPFTALAAAAEALWGSFISVSAQDVFWAESGAYTGEVSPNMLARRRLPLLPSSAILNADSSSTKTMNP